MPLSFADRKAPSLPFLTSLALHCADRYRIFGHQGTSDQRSLHGPQDREFSIVSLRVDLRTLNSRLRSSLVFSTSSSFSVSSPTSLTEVSRTSAHSSSRYVVSSSSLFFLRSGCSSSLFPFLRFLQGLGFNTLKTALLGIPQGALVVIWILLGALINSRLPPNSRTVRPPLHSLSSARTFER